ncbi:hypothetical protein TNCV_3629921 [Trichonephila clavipes]|nr:hypothetical protein TNCV_3629921 [Trichonephila clavipes]
MTVDYCFTIAATVHFPEAGISLECGTLQADTNHRRLVIFKRFQLTKLLELEGAFKEPLELEIAFVWDPIPYTYFEECISSTVQSRSQHVIGPLCKGN